MNRLAGFASALLLMSGAPGYSAPAAPQPTAHDYSQRMAKLTEIQRYAAIRNAIAESNLWCRRVMVAGYQGPHKNLDMWVARCGPKPLVDYGVFIGPDGTAQVSTCADLVKVKWPACRKLP